MLGCMRLVLSIFTGLVVSRRVVGSFRPDHLHVGINLLHQLLQNVCLLLIDRPRRVLRSWKGVRKGNPARIP